MSGASSGTYDFDPPLADLTLEAFERIGVRAAQLTVEHMQSARRSANFVLSRWTNLGVNLWKVYLVQTLMTQGVSTYPVDPSVVNVLDTYLRQYNMTAPANGLTAATVAGSASVTLGGLPSTPEAGAYVAVIVPLAVGGIVLQGIYQFTASAGANAGVIQAASAATSTSSVAVVPAFTTTAGSATVSVALTNHGLAAGQFFDVQVETSVGGLSLLGPYQVAAVQSASAFTITAPTPAGAAATVSENGGAGQVSMQNGAAQPTDIVLYPLSRNDYAALPDKLQQGRPTAYWFDRTLAPTMNIWQVPDANGPYILSYYVCRQIQDANAAGGQTTDVPYRFFEAFAAAVAAHLSMKWAPERFQMLSSYANQVWTEASDEDREKVPLRILPDFSSVYAS